MLRNCALLVLLLTRCGGFANPAAAVGKRVGSGLLLREARSESLSRAPPRGGGDGGILGPSKTVDSSSDTGMTILEGFWPKWDKLDRSIVKVSESSCLPARKGPLRALECGRRERVLIVMSGFFLPVFVPSSLSLSLNFPAFYVVGVPTGHRELCHQPVDRRR